MANNTIQIKRSVGNTTPASLNPGELAYSNTAKVLYIGSTDGATVVPIGGQRVPGTLTANQALVANSTSGIDQIQTGNLAFVGTTQGIVANGSLGTAGFVLFSGGAGSNVYWQSAGGLGANVNAQYAWTNTQSFSNTISFGSNAVINSTAYFWTSPNVNTAPIVLNGSGLAIGNSTANTTGGNAAIISVANSTSNVQITPVSITLGTSVVNTSTVTTGTLFANVSGSFVNVSGQVNTSTLFASSSANIASAVFANSTVFNANGFTSNSSGIYETGVVNAATISIGSAVVINSTALVSNGSTTNSTGEYITGLVNATSFTTGASGAGTGGLIANVTTVFIGNNTVNAFLTSTGLSVNAVTIANTSGVYTAVVNGSSITVGSAFTANSTLVNAAAINVTGQVNTATFFATTSANVGGNVQITTSQYGVTGNTTTAPTMTLTGSGLTVGNASITGAPSINIANSSGNTVINTTSIAVGPALFTANSTKMTFSGANVDASSALLNVRDIIATGNLTVSGTVTTINSQTLTVNDNIIELGSNNAGSATFTDTVDTGWFSPAGNTTTAFYSGFVRIAASSTNTTPYFRALTTTTNPNTSTTIGGTITTGTLEAYLRPYGTGTGFVANSTNITITGNSSLAVGITANTLSLTTALAVGSGGTGLATYAVGDLVYASGTTTLASLAVPGSAANGQVLQITNNLPAYGVLDAGTY